MAKNSVPGQSEKIIKEGRKRMLFVKL